MIIIVCVCFFFFNQKTAYELRISDWSSDVCSSDLIPANIYTHKTLSGSFSIRNPHLEALLVDKAKNSDAVWNSILERGGSVQHLDFLTQDEKDCYKTSFEID